ncbi:peptidoglycan-binding protein [Streptomyces sp. AC555_RSS877]|uniref:peptidoglycan-binding protein n=1 Tax=Streptomyces sp. AC555_RSS877 TaxID=2823688 RepID=UPI001C278AD5|nr:peptidoglycan-binding protein [Streptomyces sp. AC555_RSS877]
MTGVLRRIDESASERAERLAGLGDRMLKAGSKNDLLDLIDLAFAEPPPEGDPGTLESLGMRYRDQLDEAMGLHERVDRVARKGLPEVWVGDTSVLASDAVSAVSRTVSEMAEAFEGGSRALIVLADAIMEAQRQDGEGRGKLQQALSEMGSDREGFFDELRENDEEEWDRANAAHFASYGVGLMRKAVLAAGEACRVAARDLNKWATEARAGKMDTDELSAVDRLMLADTSNVKGAAEYNEILSAAELERSGRAMENLPPADRARMELLMANASSPQEKAYLMKGLAAGRSVDEIDEFAFKIQGKDPAWLQRHLSPITTQGDSLKDEGTNPDGSSVNIDDQTFNGQKWVQGGDGSEGTCVASSTVTARAMVDPLYALDITGGPSGQEDDPEAFRQRLVEEQHRLHTEGDGGEKWSGMGPEGQERIADDAIGGATGDDYQRRDMNTADERRQALTDVEKAVAEGKPVPVDVRSDDGAHAMTIIGQEGDMLQIYNPWGTTTWVSEDDFINGNMGKASNGELDDAYSVYVPQ